MIDKAYRCRLYPNKEQAALIEKSFDACRWVYNMALETKKREWETNKKSIGAYELMGMIPKWKMENPWLKDVCAQSLQQSIRDLDKAYQNFFRRVKNGETPGYPKWKKKSASTQSFRIPGNGRNVRIVDEKHIFLPKLKNVRCVISRPIEGRILNATIKRVPSGKYFVVVCCTDVPEPEMPPGNNGILGIDVGIKDLMVRSDGVKVPNNKYLKKSEKKLRREQRRLSRRQKGSNRYKKQKIKVAKAYEKVANQRSNAIHNATTQAVRDSRAIAVEDLNVKGMLKNHNSAKSTSDASMSEIIRQLQYKCEWYGRDFVKVDRFFPSTQICGNCGAVCGPKGFSKLHKRDWTCPECGAYHDRDLNAARNIAAEGQRLIDEKE